MVLTSSHVFGVTFTNISRTDDQKLFNPLTKNAKEVLSRIFVTKTAETSEYVTYQIRYSLNDNRMIPIVSESSVIDNVCQALGHGAGVPLSAIDEGSLAAYLKMSIVNEEGADVSNLAEDKGNGRWSYTGFALNRPQIDLEVIVDGRRTSDGDTIIPTDAISCNKREVQQASESTEGPATPAAVIN